MRIGWIGCGVMGQSMVKHLLAAHHQVCLYTRTKSKAEGLLSAGAEWADSPGVVAASSDLLFSIVGYPRDVEEIYLSEGGILDQAAPGTICIDMTTSDPELAKRIYDKGSERQVSVLDAPVSGGDVGAREGTLSIMVGGDRKGYEELLPIFRLMGKRVVYQGAAGSGQHTKMCNQIAIAAGMLGVCEAITYAERAGLDPQQVMKSIEHGAAGSWSLSNLGPRMIKGDNEPGFFIKHFIKDMGIAETSSVRMGMDAKALSLALSLYREFEKLGNGEKGTQALIEHYR